MNFKQLVCMSSGCLASKGHSANRKKLLLVMKLTVILLITGFLQFSLAASGQRVSLNVKNQTLEQLFKEIRSQTGFDFILDTKEINTSWRLNISLSNASLPEALDQILKGRALSYTIQERAIVIKEKEMSLMDKLSAAFSNIVVHGRVIDETGTGLQGASVKVKNTNKVTITDVDGHFTLNGVPEKAILVISYLGYETKEVEASEKIGTIQLISGAGKLNEVEVVSTGYQDIPKERATGSFTVVDNRLLNRSVSTDILSRLKGITNGLLSEGAISIRGKSTIFSNTAPLIVVDNFPFDGDINTINPETIENVTILKDAAAASIWGVRAGNGVIVITTKKGILNSVPVINIKSDLTIGKKPDLYYQPQLTSKEFINTERFLFNQGAYTGIINDGYSVISPVIDILQKIKIDPSFASIGEKEIERLSTIDYRNQQNRYLYRTSSQQRHYVDLSGGGQNQTYYISTGYDKNLPNNVSISDSRFTLKGNNTYSLIKNSLIISSDITFSNSKSYANATNSASVYLPYQELADDQGNPLPVLVSSGLRARYTDTAGNGKLLDWKYRPLEELKNKYSTSHKDLTDYRINLGLNYKVFNLLSLSANYQYYNAYTKIENLNTVESFETRDAINRYTQINPISKQITRPIPLGGIYNPTFQTIKQNVGRGQLNLNKIFDKVHELSAIAGFEIRESTFKSNSNHLYGFDPETNTNIQIDPVNQYRSYVTGGMSTLGQPPRQFFTIDRYISWYGNASYTYKTKYTIYGSYRKDESNLFGVKANQKGVPLWSTGLSWNIHKEDFFNLSWLNLLQIKASYGYNGNVNKDISAYLTGKPGLTNIFLNSLYYEIVNPPNDNLRWEKVKNINTGLYFSTKDNVISGSFEYYIKNGKDLIASSPIAPQTGVSLYTGNTANTSTKGIDIQIISKNLNGLFKWNSSFIFNYNKDKITEYKIFPSANSDIVSPIGLSPLIGYPINSLFAYKWGGLNGSGDPQGFLNGALSTDYTAIKNLNDKNQLDFFGSKIPTQFGSLRNTFSYNGFELSLNVIYKAGYYFRRESLNNSSLFNTGFVNFYQTDYENRWQNPGDENLTSVPSLIYPTNFNRSDYYLNSSALIERGDHIRLQDIQLNYQFKKNNMKNTPFPGINIYIYANNIGILWRANNHGLDPDVKTGYPQPRTIACGIKMNF